MITEKRPSTDNMCPSADGQVRCCDCRGLQPVTRGHKTVLACMNFAERWSLVADKWRRCERFSARRVRIKQEGK